MPTSKLFPYLEALFAVAVWGASFIATKVVLRDISPVTIVWLRFAMGVFILGIAVTARKQFALLNSSEWPYFALLGFLGITFHQWLQSNALQTSAASTTAFLSSRRRALRDMLYPFLRESRKAIINGTVVSGISTWG